MTEEKVFALLALLGAKHATKTGQWVKASCPLAWVRHGKGSDTNPSFGVKIEPHGKSICNCFACNVKGELSTLLTELLYEIRKGNAPKLKLAEAFKLVEEENEAGYFDHGDWYPGHKDERQVVPWPEAWLDSFQFAVDVSRAKEFLHTRGVNAKLAKELDLRYDSAGDMVCFPFRTSEGKLAGMRGRLIKPAGDFRYYDYKWKDVSNTGLVWMGEDKTDFTKPVVVVEGPFDYSAVFSVYPNVLANLSTSLNERKARRLEPAVEVLVFFDNDKAGELAYVELRKHIAKTTVVRQMPYPSKKVKDPGEMSRADIFSALSKFVTI
jgi:DNA primase